MKLFVVISLAALLAGCATPNDAVSNKSSPQHGNAAIRYNPESVQMVSIDGKAYPRPTLAQAVVTGQPDTYVTPGKHKVVATLDFRIQGFSRTVSPIPKEACFIAESGKTYNVSALIVPRKLFDTTTPIDWNPVISEFVTALDAKNVTQTCN